MNDTADKIKQLSEIYRDYTVDVLRKMVAVKGESGTEGDRCKIIEALCREAGFDGVFTDGLGSVVGRVGSGKKKLAFDAHIDTVGIGDPTQWETNPYGGEIRDEYLYGRGTSDQLGGAASMIAAGRILKELGYAGEYSVFFTFTVMEEDCDGIAWLYLIGEEGLRPDYVVSTEPSCNHLHRGHRGRMEIEIQLKGRACHGSRPHEGDSAAYKASKAALAIQKLNSDLQPDNENFLGKGTVTVSSMHVTGPSQCSVPDTARLYLDRRLTWGEDAPLAIGQVEHYIQEAIDEKPYRVFMPEYQKRGYKNTDYTQELYFPTWKLPADHPLVAATENAYQMLFKEVMITEAHVGSTNAVAFAGRYGIPAVIVGPGDPAEAHKANEKIKVDNLTACSALYALLPYILDDMK